MSNFEKFNNICSIILKLIYLNLLWMLFSIGGLIIGGIGPATYATVSIIRQWMLGNETNNIFKTFKRYFKENYKQSVLISVIYFLVGLILYVDLLGIQSTILRIVIIIISSCYLISAMYIYPVMAHYDIDNIMLKIKMSFIFGFAYLHYSVLLSLVILIFGVLLLSYLVLFAPLLGISVPLFLIMWTARQVFAAIEEKSGEENVNERNERR